MCFRPADVNTQSWAPRVGAYPGTRLALDERAAALSRRRGGSVDPGGPAACLGSPPLARAAACKASPPPPGGPDEAVAAHIHRLGSAVHGAFGVAPAAKCGILGYPAVSEDYCTYHLLPDETRARLLLKQIWIPVAKDGGADS